MKQNIWKWLAGGFVLLMLAIVIAADSGTLPNFVRSLYHFPNGDWAGHFALYGILAYLSTRAFPRRVKVAGRSLPLAALVVILMAVLEEVSQFWFPLRTPDWRDVAFGVLGILIGSWLATWKSK